MNKLGRISLFLVLTASLAIPSVAGAAQPVYSTCITVEPAGAGVYTVTAKVTDLTAKALVTQATLKVPVDEPANTETLLPDGETKVLLAVSLNSAKHTATYSVEIRRAAEILAASSASVPLTP